MSEVEDDFRRRLAEAEETLRAIREGEVDALVVRHAEREQVFSLGGDESYRAFMEAMETGAVALDEKGRVLYANAAFAELVERPGDELPGVPLTVLLEPAAALAVDALLKGVVDERQTMEVVARAGTLHLVVSAAPLPLAFARGHALTFTDISARVEAAEAEEAERVGSAILTFANEAVVVCDELGRVTHANAAARRLTEGDPADRPLAEAFALALGSDTGLIDADDLVNVALGGGSLRGVNVCAHATARGPHDLLVSAAPLMRGRTRIAGCIVTMVDVTAQKALEKQQLLLTRELEHRVKNLLALVLSISTRTARATPEPRAFIERFNQRLVALAATQDLLARSGWAALSLEELVVAEFAPFLPAPSPRVRLVGLDRKVASEASVALGLAFHELVTNAVKYGALSNERGRVSIAGSDGADGGLSLVWREEDGPPVVPPTRHGFGQTLITSGFGSSSGAVVEVRFLPEGVECRVGLPASMLA